MTILNKELRNQLTDFFDKEELVSYLPITVEDILDSFEDEILEILDDLCEIMGIEPETDEDD